MTDVKQNRRRGVEHDPGKRSIANWLGISLVLMALLNLGPAAYEVVDSIRAERPVGWSGWMLAILFISGIQVMYAIYLMQLPDFSTVWIVAFATMAIAAVYSMALAILIWAPAGNRWLLFLEFDLQLRGKVAMWCGCMLGCCCLLTYFCGQEAIRWQRIYAARWYREGDRRT